jgi:predicted acetyltransferase
MIKYGNTTYFGGYNMKIELIELSLQDGREIYDMLQDIGEGENGFMNSAYGLTYDEFKEFLAKNVSMSKGIGLAPNQVPQTIYWLIVDGSPVGIGKLRDYLTEGLRKEGGHIGYSIRPSERGKGYGAIILKEILNKAREKGVEQALLTCNENNIASRKVIEANGGELEDIHEGKCRYWI